ncbi:Fmp10p Ecym_7476 [Eremothecium cymbalariae DBVPG|uniref:Thioesterase domain-containing protein n=1 Tax=Eremothecium cymbalariae (strain CBS 270.75 / DBVPG 7215 / KCTC 17166 / NRRL Y-17582) TaxID=931890 RepID=G8JWS8_ERECY|nr:hypothetical protein Ecym_7476 [Eremothecium cymbalariae DBVPG\
MKLHNPMIGSKLATLIFKRTLFAERQFVVKNPKPSRKYIGYGIFGAAFGLGWFATQHMSYSDVIASCMFDKLPADDEKVKNYQAMLLHRANNLPITKQLVENGYIQVYPETTDILLNKTLRVPGGISIDPLYFYNPKLKSTVGVYHVGMKLTGYPFLIHGGILATLLSDIMKEAVKFTFSSNAQMMDNLDVAYKFPTFANQFVIVRTTEIEQHGKTVKLKSTILDQSGERTLVNGKGAFSLK